MFVANFLATFFIKLNLHQVW